jgi:hypothetical protein
MGYYAVKNTCYSYVIGISWVLTTSEKAMQINGNLIGKSRADGEI